jgi:subfamily B ATP-binding cassette protein MsbA
MAKAWFERAGKLRGTIIITNPDRIVVIHDGRIIEQGTHAELLNRQGMYYYLNRKGFQQ